MKMKKILKRIAKENGVTVEEFFTSVESFQEIRALSILYMCQ